MLIIWTGWRMLWEKVTVIGFTLVLQFALLAVIDHDGRVCRDGCGCIVSFVLRNNKSNPDRCVQEPSGCLFSAAKRSIILSCVTDSRLWPFRHLQSQSPAGDVMWPVLPSWSLQWKSWSSRNSQDVKSSEIGILKFASNSGQAKSSVSTIWV